MGQSVTGSAGRRSSGTATTSWPAGCAGGPRRGKWAEAVPARHGERRPGVAAVRFPEDGPARAGGGGVDRPVRHLAPPGDHQAGRRPGRGPGDGGGARLLEAPSSGRRKPAAALGLGAAVALVSGHGCRRAGAAWPALEPDGGRRYGRPAADARSSPSRRPMRLWVDRTVARPGRGTSCSPAPTAVSRERRSGYRRWPTTGFDVVYLPPIHPIGTRPEGPQQHAGRRARRSRQPLGHRLRRGGHTAIDPELGTVEDFERLSRRAGRHGGRPRLRPAVLARPSPG